MIQIAVDAYRTLGPSNALPTDYLVPYYIDAPCPLSGGLLTETTLMCQCYGSRYDITTGAVINGPATKALILYDVEEVEGSVRVRA